MTNEEITSTIQDIVPSIKKLKKHANTLKKSNKVRLLINRAIFNHEFERMQISEKDTPPEFKCWTFELPNGKIKYVRKRTEK